MIMSLGLQVLSPARCQVATAMWMTKPVVPTEAALLALQIKIIQKSRTVISINTAPPIVRTRRVGKGNKACLAPVDKYTSRPDTDTFNDMTMLK